MSLEQLVICNCSQVLTGIKAANLITCLHQKYPDAVLGIKSLEKRCASLGLKYKTLCSCADFILVYVYSEPILEKIFQDTAAARYLAGAGYKIGNCRFMLEQLKKRFSSDCAFPHEIGIFLGYPVEDVEGFVKNRGENCKYSGYWKVYGDTGRAKKLFEAYESCRLRCVKMAMKGVPIEKIAKSAEIESA